MARIQLSGLISDISGSVGGTTFSRNAAGFVAKRRISGKRVRTAKQQISLQQSALINSTWSGFTYSEKEAWNTFAGLHTKTTRYGQVKTLCGFTWFKSVASAQYFSAGTLPTAPPAYTYPAFLPTFTLDCSIDGVIVNWSTPIVFADVDLYVYTTSPIRGTARYNRGGYRLTDIGAVDYSSSFDITEGWEEAHNLVWADLFTGGNFYINVQIFAISKTTFLTGTCVSATGSL